MEQQYQHDGSVLSFSERRPEASSLMTGKQMRAARGLLNWSVRDLSLATGIGTATINRYEIVPGTPPSRRGYLEKIRKAFEDQGVQFVETDNGHFGIIFSLHKPDPTNS